ncbi:MAG: rod shape-determining protein MreD [Flavobacteriaceae bacterium]|nr:rod shape-determining protein MreD [Flavobacteriaceae bacterium]
MSNNSFLIGIRFLVLLLLQVLIFNKLNLSIAVTPYVYVIYFILFPIKEKRVSFLFTSFLLGLAIDMFMNSGGIHAAASVTTAYFRPAILKAVFGISYETQSLKFRQATGYQKVIIVLLLTLIHHSVLFFLETFNLNLFLFTLTKVFLTAIFTTVLSILLIHLFRPSTK